MVSLVLQFAAFLRLRATAPSAARPFAVPGGLRGAWMLAACSFALCFTLLVLEVAGTTGWEETMPFAVTLLFLPLASGAGVLWARTAERQRDSLPNYRKPPTLRVGRATPRRRAKQRRSWVNGARAWCAGERARGSCPPPFPTCNGQAGRVYKFSFS
jgi:hypothetical protein